MKRTYEYEYNWGEMSATIEIDDEVLTIEDCKMLLEFFTWRYDKDADPYDELGRLYCRRAMAFATCNDHNTYGVIKDFEEAEGFPKVDGSQGIKLINVDGIDFSEIEIELVEQ